MCYSRSTEHRQTAESGQVLRLHLITRYAFFLSDLSANGVLARQSHASSRTGQRPSVRRILFIRHQGSVLHSTTFQPPLHQTGHRHHSSGIRVLVYAQHKRYGSCALPLLVAGCAQSERSVSPPRQLVVGARLRLLCGQRGVRASVCWHAQSDG